MINVSASPKKIIYVRKDCIWNPATCSCEHCKYVSSFTDDSVITCDEIMEEAKTFITNFNEKNEIFKTKSFYILLAFLLIITALLIAVSIYCYLIKYKAKEKHLLPFYVKNNKSKELLY